MGKVRVGPTRHEVLDDGRHRTSAVLQYEDYRRRMWFVTSGDVPFLEHNRGDLWLPAALIVAMRRGEPLRLADPISPRRRASLRRIQEILSTWYPERMTRVRIHAPEPETPPAKGMPDRSKARVGLSRRPPPDRRIQATCFTGGLDSFYSLTKHRRRVGAVVYAVGLDIPPWEVEAARRVTAMVERVAEEHGVRALLTVTNLRRRTHRGVSWGFELHGAVLASVATLFSPVASLIHVPATHTYRDLLPWGSHPLVDPLWSTERLRIVHDGAEASRIDKILRIVDDPLVQRNLRVCFSEYEQVNCCRCLKCLRTMASLAVVDRLQDFPTFGEPLDIDLFRALRLRTDNDLTHMEDLSRLLARVGGHGEIREAVDEITGEFRERRLAGAPSWQPGGESLPVPHAPSSS